jgi:small subunit ribosomal protein S20
MPHTRSAKKNMRKTEKRRLRNRLAKKAIKVQLKAFLTALDGPIDELKKQYNLTAKKLDKAAAKKVIHPNLAARKKSQLARALHDKQQPPKPA